MQALILALRLLTWNVESGGSDPAVLADQLRAMNGYQIYGLTEVAPGDAPLFRQAVGADYGSILSVTGGDDRLLILYDKNKLELLDSQELAAHDGLRMNDVNFRHCSPLVGHFRDQQAQTEFLLVLTHLACGEAELRVEQARALREWVADQKLPVLAIGGFDFDYTFVASKGNAAFDAFLEEDHWQWVKPDPLVDTNWADRDEDGVDDYPGSMLDFVFVGGQAKQWQAEASVLVRDGDFPDDERTSDHRPVELNVVDTSETTPSFPFPADNESIAELKKRRIENLRRAYEILARKEAAGTVSLDVVVQAHLQLLDAELEVAESREERIAIVEKQLDRAKQLVTRIRSMYEQGGPNVTGEQVHGAMDLYLRIRIRLEELKAA